MERSGIKIWMIGRKRRSEEGKERGVREIMKNVEEGKESVDEEMLVIDYLRKKYGIWKKKKMIEEKEKIRKEQMREMMRRRKEEIGMIDK